MKRILLSAGSEKILESLSAMVKELTGAEILCALNASESRKILEGPKDVDFVIINTPLKDEQGLELSVNIADSMMKPVMVITGEESYARAAAQLSESGVIAVRRPVDKKTFTCAVSDLAAASVIVSRIREKNRTLEDKLEELKLINRAKAMLMQQLRMTESQAHRYIEKQAMDLRLSKKKIAQNILKTYYNK